MLQEHEIARLEKEHSNTKYTVVRNIHGTLKFERYLVSDTGVMYSLTSRKHLYPSLGKLVHPVITLYPGTEARWSRASPQVTFKVNMIVKQSFERRRQEGFQIVHINGNPLDNSLKNLAYPTAGNKNAPAAPPISKETSWKTIGVLPWNGLPFNEYEVSDMGHVRRKYGYDLLKLQCSSEGYVQYAATTGSYDWSSLVSGSINERSASLVSWRLHWFPPTYNPPDSPCGQGKAKKRHCISCPLVEPQMYELLKAFGAVPELDPDAHLIDYILKCLPRSDVGLIRGIWGHVWPALFRVLSQIDSLIHSQYDNGQSREKSTERPIQGLTKSPQGNDS
ncbi:hypothetical protein BJV82DRAFT_671722 [Fennellomyces sp. T-0311]|nr:hypothetical protein BJV82DRAFT_671722 [Fennellomyces sp. T-0311]